MTRRNDTASRRTRGLDLTAASRAARYRQRKRVRVLEADWIRRDLVRFYQDHEILTTVFVAAKNFYRGSALVQQLISEQQFLTTTLKNAGTGFIGIEAVTAQLQGATIELIRPKFLPEMENTNGR